MKAEEVNGDLIEIADEKNIRKKRESGTEKTADIKILFPTTYGKTRFTSMNKVKEQAANNPDALGFFSQCSLYGIELQQEQKNHERRNDDPENLSSVLRRRREAIPAQEGLG